MSTIRAFIEKIDAELQTRNLPSSVAMMSEAVRSAGDEIVEEVSELICFLLDLAEEKGGMPNGESTIESAADVDLGDAEDDAENEWNETLHKIDNFLKIRPEPSLAPLLLGDDEHFRNLTDAIPINDAFLQTENAGENDIRKITKGHLIQVLNSHTLVRKIFDHVYRALAERKSSEPLPDKSLRKSMAEEAIRLGSTRVQEIREQDPTFPVPLESKDVLAFKNFIAPLKKQQGATLIFNADEKGFPFEYAPSEESASPSEGTDASRAYITLKPEHKGMIAVHFVAICDLLRKAGISSRAKAINPYYVPDRYDNMVFLIPHAQKQQAQEIIERYLRESEIGSDEHLPASTEYANGLSWGFEPSNENREYAMEVTREDQASFNTYTAARILPFYIERLITLASKEDAHKERLKNELKRVNGIKSRVYGQIPMPNADAEPISEE